MNHLVVNGVDFGGELPGEWTVEELVRVLETEVLSQDEVVVDVTVDGTPFAFAPELPGPRLECVESVSVWSRRIGEVVGSAVDSATETVRHFVREVGEAVAALRVGRDAEGWEAQGRAMASLRVFLDLAERLGATLSGGLGPTPEAGAPVRAVAGELATRLAVVQAAADAEDTIEICDAMEDIADWLIGAWLGLWTNPAAADDGKRAS